MLKIKVICWEFWQGGDATLKLLFTSIFLKNGGGTLRGTWTRSCLNPLLVSLALSPLRRIRILLDFDTEKLLLVLERLKNFIRKFYCHKWWLKSLIHFGSHPFDPLDIENLWAPTFLITVKTKTVVRRYEKKSL